jgi:methyl-accepting chemotaxis protein
MDVSRATPSPAPAVLWMDDERPTTAELLEAWRETTHAAELAERLARLAADAADQAEQDTEAYEQIADMAESARKAAERAASSARTAATEARHRADLSRDVGLRDAHRAVDAAQADEVDARGRCHEGEARAREALEDR